MTGKILKQKDFDIGKDYYQITLEGGLDADYEVCVWCYSGYNTLFGFITSSHDLVLYEPGLSKTRALTLFDSLSEKELLKRIKKMEV